MLKEVKKSLASIRCFSFVCYFWGGFSQRVNRRIFLLWWLFTVLYKVSFLTCLQFATKLKLCNINKWQSGLKCTAWVSTYLFHYLVIWLFLLILNILKRWSFSEFFLSPYSQRKQRKLFILCLAYVWLGYISFIKMLITSSHFCLPSLKCVGFFLTPSAINLMLPCL